MTTPILNNCSDNHELCRNGELPPASMAESVINFITNSFIANSATCTNKTIIEQNSTINCNTPELIKANISAAKSTVCKLAIMNPLIKDADIYCKACSISNATQNIIVSFSATCGVVNNIAKSVRSDVQGQLTPKSLFKVSSLPAAAEGQFVEIINNIAASFSDTTALQIYQGLIAIQNIDVSANSGQTHKKGILQNAIYDVVANALLASNTFGEAVNRLAELQVQVDGKQIVDDAATAANKAKNTVYIIAVGIACIVLIVVAVLLSIMLRDPSMLAPAKVGGGKEKRNNGKSSYIHVLI